MTGEKKIDFSKLNFKVVSTGKRSDGTNKEKSAEESIKNDKETKRTIEYVIDVETGEIIDAKEYFKNDESVIFKTKRRLQEAIQGIATPKFVCISCEQLITLNVKKERNGYYFAHYKDSDECEIKTSLRLSKEAILEDTFGNKKNESERHIKLKTLIAAYLQSNMDKNNGISKVEVESRISHKLFESKWRIPDVFGIYNGTRIAFELHLSTTFLSVIIGREVFYRSINTFIMWIFNFESPFIDTPSTMVKNITYSNNRNYFEIDEETIKRSNEVHDLILRCHWQEIKVVNDREEVEWNNEYITLSDLTFNQETYQVYYYDSEANLTDKEREQAKIDWDEKYRLYIEKNRAIDKELIVYKRKKEKEEKLDRARIDNIESIITELRDGEVIPKEFEKNKRFGFKVNGKVIIEAKYSEVSPFKDGLAKVKRNRKYGFINYYGNEVIPCLYSYPRDYYNGHNVLLYKSKFISRYHVYNSDKKIIDLVSLEEVKHSISQSYMIRLPKSMLNEKHISLRYVKGFIEWTYDDNCNSPVTSLIHDSYELLPNGDEDLYIIKRNDKVGIVRNMHSIGKIVLPSVFDNIFIEGKELLIVYQDQKCGLYNFIGERIIDLKYKKLIWFRENIVIAIKGDLYGIIDFNENCILDFDYQLIKSLTPSSLLLIKKGDLNGVYSIDQKLLLIPIKYNDIKLSMNYLFIKSGDLWGLCNMEGGQIIECKYDNIKRYRNFFAVQKNKKWGLIDSDGITLVACLYENMQIIGKFRIAKLNRKWALLDKEFNVLTDFIYDSITLQRFSNKTGELVHLLHVKKNKKNGILDKDGKVLVDCIYSKLQDFYEGFTTIRNKNRKSSEKVYGLARYEKGSYRGYVDIDGNEYWQYWKDSRDF